MTVLDQPTVSTPESPVSKRRRWARFVLPTYSWLVIAYLVFPIIVMIFYSFNKTIGSMQLVSFSWNGFTSQWYHQWSNVPGLTASFWLSIRLALVSTLIATVLGTMLAIALVRYRPPRFRGKGAFEQVIFLNIAAPEIVMGASLSAILLVVALLGIFLYARLLGSRTIEQYL